MCENCPSNSREAKPRDFTFEDLMETLLRHGNGFPSKYTFYSYVNYMNEHARRELEGDRLKWTQRRMSEFGYSLPDTKLCAKLYEQGQAAVKLFKEKGIQHQPRKRNV